MSEANFTESVVEKAALAWLESLGYAVRGGEEIAGKLRGDSDNSSRASVRAKNALAQILCKCTKCILLLSRPLTGLFNLKSAATYEKLTFG
jgi:hypothetical protein